MRMRALCVRTRSVSTDEIGPPSEAKAVADSVSQSRTAEVTRVILPGILSGLGRTQRCYERDNFPGLVVRHAALERRHVRVLATVPDLVEHDALGIARQRQVRGLALAIALVHIRAVAEAFRP